MNDFEVNKEAMTLKVFDNEVTLCNFGFYMSMVDDFIEDGISERIAHYMAFQELLDLGLC